MNVIHDGNEYDFRPAMKAGRLCVGAQREFLPARVLQESRRWEGNREDEGTRGQGTPDAFDRAPLLRAFNEMFCQARKQDC